MEKKKALKRLCLLILALFFAVIFFVWLLDPFYQYHEPFFGLKKVLYDRDNQVPGTIRSFEYDTVILGSSVAENFDSSFIDSTYDCETLKIIRASGSVADLLYYLEQAHEEQDLERVFWCLDIFALTAPMEVTLYGEDIPRYLHTENVLDDIPYIFNKEVIMKKIPMMLAYSFMDINTGGHAYDWSADKTFGAAKAMTAYAKPEDSGTVESRDFSSEKALIGQNIESVISEIKSHPEVEYTVMFPPYSLLWWDCGYVNGEREKYGYILEQVLSELLECENATVHFFMAEKDIVCNLDNYMDMIHYTPQINQYMLDGVAQGTHEVTKDNLGEILTKVEENFDYIISEGIYEYYPKK
ncbi:MAG: hypothetical protein IJZ82_08170 [Lachnospiraceae bacterium]|nr:hypothetical protein [Lachnospiraceae bacterium]